MGNSLLRQSKRQFRSQTFDWALVGVTPFCTRVIDPRTNILAQKYSIDIACIQSQWHTYVLRRNNPANLVTIYDLLQQKQTNFCSSNRQAAVIVEYIPYRLSDLGSLSFEQGLCILKSVLQGYRILRQHKIEFYLLDETNICFNQKGKCKFWINQNLYLSKPSTNRIVSQFNFIKSLLEIIQPRMVELTAQYESKKNRLTSLTVARFLLFIRSLNIQSLDQITFLRYNSGLSESQLKIIKYYTDHYSPCDYKTNNKISVSKHQQNPIGVNRKSQLKFKKQNKQQVEGKFLNQLYLSKKLSLAFHLNAGMRRRSHLQNRKQGTQALLSPRRQSDVVLQHNNNLNQQFESRAKKKGFYSPPFHTSYQSYIE